MTLSYCQYRCLLSTENWTHKDRVHNIPPHCPQTTVKRVICCLIFNVHIHHFKLTAMTCFMVAPSSDRELSCSQSRTFIRNCPSSGSWAASLSGMTSFPTLYSFSKENIWRLPQFWHRCCDECSLFREGTYQWVPSPCWNEPPMDFQTWMNLLIF